MKKYTIVAVLALMVLVFSGCSLDPSATTAPTKTSTITTKDSTTAIAKTKEKLAQAKAQAVAWKANAILAGYNFKVPTDGDIANLTETFVFGSPDDPTNWWTYSVSSDGKVIRAVIPKEDFLGKDLQPIGEKYWVKSYVEAITAADNNGGLDYRAKYPGAEVSVTLAQILPKNWTWYIVEYRSAENSKKIRVNAYDGKIYDDNGNVVSSQK